MIITNLHSTKILLAYQVIPNLNPVFSQQISQNSYKEYLFQKNTPHKVNKTE